MEALPATIDALAEARDQPRDGGRREGDLQFMERVEGAAEGEEEGEGDWEEEEDGEVLEEGHSDDGTFKGGLDVGQTGNVVSETASEPVSDELAEYETEQEVGPPYNHAVDRSPRPVGNSRRRRLRRRRSGANTYQLPGGGPGITTSGRGWSRHLPATGPSLTAPFLTWLLWLEHCRRASEVEGKARAAARAFVVRAGALAPVLEACFRVLRASQVPCISTVRHGWAAAAVFFFWG